MSSIKIENEKAFEWHESTLGPLTLAKTCGRPCFVRVFGKTEKDADKNTDAILKAVNNYQTLLDSNAELLAALRELQSFTEAKVKSYNIKNSLYFRTINVMANGLHNKFNK